MPFLLFNPNDNLDLCPGTTFVLDIFFITHSMQSFSNLQTTNSYFLLLYLQKFVIVKFSIKSMALGGPFIQKEIIEFFLLFFMLISKKYFLLMTIQTLETKDNVYNSSGT